MREDIKFGCIKSELDGTEVDLDKVYSSKKSLPIPDIYDYSDKFSSLLNVKNQGNTSMCVCYSLAYAIESMEIMKNGESDFQLDKKRIYNSRSDKLHDNGMQFKEALKFLKNEGYKYKNEKHDIIEYGKIGSINVVKQALIANGPCLFGLPAYNTNRDDFWIPDGTFQGGHAIACVGYNKEGFILLNSWGENWGDKGKAIFKYDDFDLLWEAWSVIK